MQDLPNQPTRRVSVVLGAAMVGALLTGAVLSLPQGFRSDLYADQASRARVAQQNLSTANDLSTAFRNVAEAIKPSVVSISTSRTVSVRRGGGFRGLPPEMRRQLPREFEDFFDFGMPRRGGNRESPREQRVQTGMGSGVIVREDGYILTNNHVVKDADEVEVELSDGRTLTGDVVGTDPETDLAVLKIDAGQLQPVTFGDSDNIQVGDWVLAIGSPFGLDQTVTAGIISGKNRVQGIIRGEGFAGFEDFLQTDAAINPGNSGGPLVNLRGELVGINTAIASRSGGNNGIGFAIPVAMAKPVLTSIIETGDVRRAFLGASGDDVDSDTIQKYSLKTDSGALITEVVDGQPAAQAGLEPGDVVTEVDGREVNSWIRFRNYIASRKPGAKVEMKVNRNGQTMTVTATLGELTSDAIALFGNGQADGDGQDVLGATVEPLTRETAERFDIDPGRGGLLVVAVEDASLAADAGLRVGDVIVEANRRPIDSIDELQEFASRFRNSGEPLSVTIRRGNRNILMPFPRDRSQR